MLEKISDLLKKKKKIECVMFERPLKKKKSESGGENSVMYQSGRFSYWLLLILCIYVYEKINSLAFFVMWLFALHLHYELLFSIVALAAVFLCSLCEYLICIKKLEIFSFREQ